MYSARPTALYFLWSALVRITYMPAYRSILVALSATMGVQSISLSNLLDMPVDPLVLALRPAGI